MDEAIVITTLPENKLIQITEVDSFRIIAGEIGFNFDCFCASKLRKESQLKLHKWKQLFFRSNKARPLP